MRQDARTLGRMRPESVLGVVSPSSLRNSIKPVALIPVWWPFKVCLVTVKNVTLKRIREQDRKLSWPIRMTPQK
jgi:hypothetical protein